MTKARQRERKKQRRSGKSGPNVSTFRSVPFRRQRGDRHSNRIAGRSLETVSLLSFQISMGAEPASLKNTVA